MAPAAAVKNIQSLLISTDKSGTQDHSTLLAVYKRFDALLEEQNISRPAVILFHGDYSWFDLDMLTFLREKKIIHH